MWACARLRGECVYLCVRYDSNYGCPEPQRMDWEKPVMLHTLTHSCSCYTLVTATNSIGYRGERCLSWKQTQSEFLCFITAEHSCHRQKKNQTEHVTLQTNQKKNMLKFWSLTFCVRPDRFFYMTQAICGWHQEITAHMPSVRVSVTLCDTNGAGE